MELPKQESNSQNGLILGVGNVLQGDDGIGVMMLKYLEAAYRFPQNVELVDGGISGACVNSSVAGKDWVVILDALNIGGKPGDTEILSLDDFLNMQSAVRLSPHQINFFDLIRIMRIEGTAPKDLIFIGIIPEKMEMGTEISAAALKGMEKAIACLMETLKGKNIHPKPSAQNAAPDYWWLN